MNPNKSPKKNITKKKVVTKKNKNSKTSGYKFHKKMNGYDFYAPSKTNGKKYDVYRNGKKLASFGARSYQQYKDKIGYYRGSNHGDSDRRKRYLLRHKKDKLTQKYKNRESAGWFSEKYLW